jgi:hypothetical protein
MTNIICHHNGKYNFYTTVSDGFCYESALTLDQVREVVKEQNGLDQLSSSLSDSRRDKCDRIVKNLRAESDEPLPSNQP